MSSLKLLKPLIVILGPTASGKSELALKLAKKFRGEIVSADSRQIYKKMDIGTAKPYLNQKIKATLRPVRFAQGRPEEFEGRHAPFDSAHGLSENRRQGDKNVMVSLSNHANKKLNPVIIKGIPHYLIDIINPDESFSVAEYKELAIKIIRDIQSRGKIPILVGGTGLYISAIVDNIEIPKVKPNPKLRKKMEKTPLGKLLKKLEKLDPVTFEIIDKNNKRRVIRALEVTISTGKPFSKQREKGAPLFDILEIGIDLPRQTLYEKIDQRVEKMINPEYSERINGERSRTMKDNLIKETKRLSKKYSWKLPSMSGISYKEIGMYLRGEISLEKAKELMKFRTHAYARRQLTWFRRDKKTKWIKNYTQAQKLIKKFLA